VHPASMLRMGAFVNKYLKDRSGLRVLDVGGQDINGTYKPLFADHRYEACDCHPGTNVDVVLSDPYDWIEYPDCSVDVVVCGQVLEHCEFDYLIVRQIGRVLRPGGLACIIVPGSGPKHEEPDFRRYTDTALRQITEMAGLQVLESDTGRVYSRWGDICVVAMKPALEEAATIVRKSKGGSK